MKLTGPTFFAGTFTLFVALGLAIKAAWNDKYPRLYDQCPTCHARLSSRDRIELNRAMGEHRTEHARQHAGRN